MGWGAKQWLRITKEATYGVFDASATTDNIAWFRLPRGNPFTPRVVPQRVVIRSADGGNRRIQVVSSRKVVAGALSTLFYPSQAQFLLDAALTFTAGGELNSYTADYFDSQQVHRFLGGKVQTLALPGTAQGDWLPANVGWIFQQQDGAPPTLAQPADTVFPTDVPFKHVESKGLFKLATVAQTAYKSLGVTITNQLASTFDEDEWITACYYAGRDVDLAVSKQYLTTAMRDAFEAQTALTLEASWARTGGRTVKLDLKTASYAADCGDDLPIDGACYQDISIQAFYDASASTDVAFTVAGP